MFVAKFLQTKKKSGGGVQTKKKCGGGVQNEKKCGGGVQESKIVQRATQDSVKKIWLNFGGGQIWPKLANSCTQKIENRHIGTRG